MSRRCWSIFCLAAALFAIDAGAQTAEPVAIHSSAWRTNYPPPMPALQPPVAFFRQLLMMSPVERALALTNRTPEVRARILAKVRDYEKLEPDERELRLRATELRWYLAPLMRTPPADREVLLSQVPPDLLGLVNSRLTQWDALPASSRTEFLANDKTAHYFAQTPSAASTDPGKERIAEQFSEFFDLKPDEKRRLLGTLSEAERAQMEKTLQTFGQLPAPQRSQCLHNFAMFAGMSGAERAEFLRNAESWSKMSPRERKAWRDLVAEVPMWPPLPARFMQPPPMPPPPAYVPKNGKASMATNK